jgi:hypothetical protein
MMVDKEKEKLYLELRKDTVVKKHESEGLYDKYILTLSSASLGFSVAFIKDIPFLNHNENWIIVTSWLCFTIASIITLISFKTSSIAFSQLIAYYDARYKNPDVALPKGFKTITSILNYSGSIAFIIGLILTFIYIWMNLNNHYVRQ